MKLVETAPHEFNANFLYNSHGLAPWFGMDAVVKAGDGSEGGEFRHDGERWTARLSYRDSNIVHPGDETPDGTEWDLPADDDTRVPTLRREYQLKVSRHPDEDPQGEQDFSVHIAPRWPGMEGLKSDGSTVDIAVPDSFGEGLNCKVRGSNIEFERYETLLQLAFDSVTISAQYWESPHESSNITDAERYVRLHQEESGPVHARDGPIAELSHLLEDDRTGYRKVVQNDDDEHGRNLPGYYHTATLGPRRIGAAWPHHAVPKEVKHYYAREALSKSDEHPLRHPKLGASYQVSRWDETLSLSDLGQMSDELEETVHSVLMAAGIDVAPVQGDGPYVPDAYFEPECQESESQPVTLNITSIKQNQESVVVRHLSDGLSPVQWESLTTLVTDGGTVSPDDIADEHGRHTESVRRALREMSDLVTTKYAEVGLKSDYVAEMVHEAVKDARDATKRAVETAAKTMEAADKGLSEGMANWIAWCERHGVDISNRRESLEIDLGEFDALSWSFGRPKNVTPRVTTAFELWKDAHQDTERFRMATVKFTSDGKTHELPAWQFL